VDHKDLAAWKQSMDLVEVVYGATRRFPREELYGLTSQVRRAAVSIPSNLSEGAARRSPKEFVNFLSISLGSLAELETQLLIAQRLGYLDPTPMIAQLHTVRALILGLRKRKTT